MGKVLSQEMVFEKINFHMQQNKARSILILHMKSQSKIDERPNCEAWNHKIRRQPREKLCYIDLGNDLSVKLHQQFKSQNQK
jgi:hypothetical protein